MFANEMTQRAQAKLQQEYLARLAYLRQFGGDWGRVRMLFSKLQEYRNYNRMNAPTTTAPTKRAA